MVRKILAIVLVIACTATALVFTSTSASAAIPAEFEKTTVVSGLNDPTAFRFGPDGDIYIAEQHGVIKVFRGGTIKVLGAVSTINDHEKGLLGIELDKNFATNGYLYASYTHTDGYARLSRFTVVNDTLDMASEFLFFKSDQLASIYHNANDIHHGPDGKLWWTVGDNLTTGNSQSLDSIHGKVARFDLDGSSANDNPWHGEADKVDEIYALGLRNPYRFTFLPNGKAIVADVGGALHEELNIISSGANYGWPQYEGSCGGCGFANPVFTYPHNGQNSALSAVALYNGTTFSAKYQNALFYGDYARHTIRYLKFDSTFTSVISDSAFDDDAGTIVDMHVGPDQNLYYVSIFSGTLHKIAPSGGNRVPEATAAADPTAGLAPMTVNFSSAGSSDPDGTPLGYTWNFGDGATSTDANPSHTYTGNGTYTATLTVSDGEKTATDVVVITVGNRPPEATIQAPAVDAKYNAGDTISYSGRATDPEDGEMPASAFSWEIVFHHADHVHPYLGPIDGIKSGSFSIGRDASNESNTWYRIILTVTDAGGLKHTTYRDVNPNLVNLTVQTDTAGAKFTVDGNLYSSAYVHQEVVGVDHGVSLTSPQTIGGKKYRFRTWSDGGAQTHTYRVPATDSTLTASLFEALPVPSPWQTGDIGNPALAGTADYDAQNQAFVVDGGGNDIWGTTDQFRYVHQPLTGDGEIVTRVTSQSPADPWSKSGIMIKESTAAGSPYAMVAVTPANGIVMQHNFTGNAGPRPQYAFPVWLKLKRAGNVFTSFYSSNGTSWTQLGQATVAMSASATAGLFVTAHTSAGLCTTVFDNVGVTKAPNAAPTANSQTVTTAKDTAANIKLTGSDPNGDPLTYGVTSQPTNGTLSGTAPNLTYTPNPGFTGSDSFNFKVNDGTSDSATATVSITVTVPLPSPWSNNDVGAPALAGSAGYSTTGQTFTVKGAGADIWVSNDQFHYVHQPLTGDGEIVARVTSQSRTHASAKAGMMIKQSTAAFSPYAMVGITPDNGYKFQWSFNPESASGGAYTSPNAWVKLKRVGSTFSAYKSADGVAWTQIGSTKTITMSTSATVGLFVSSHDAGAISTATFDNVKVTPITPAPNTPPVAKDSSVTTAKDTPVATPLSALDSEDDPLTYTVVSQPAHGTLSGTAPNLTFTPHSGYTGNDSFTFKANDGKADSNVASVSIAITPPAGSLPAPWQQKDVGVVTPGPGSGGYDSATQTFTVKGGGYDIWTTHDDFRYVYQTLNGDGEIIARVTSQTNTHASAKAGVMIKESATAFAPYSFLGITPSNGYKFQWNFQTQSVSGGSYSLPDAWVRLTRVGNVVTAYKSSNGTTWTQVSQKTVTMNATATIGLFVTSHNSGALGTATFDNVSVTSPSADSAAISEESASPTESATTNQPDSGDSPAGEETKGTEQESDSGKEGAKSQETIGNEKTEENGTGGTQTGTDTSGNTGTNRDPGTNGGTGANEEPGGEASGSPGTG
jgi:glucose/arabinose dehydrogenase/regulation of enolase protein 1 (concanavalin A-like superfamily)